MGKLVRTPTNFFFISKSFTVFSDMCKYPEKGKGLTELKGEECFWDVMSKESGLRWGPCLLSCL